MPREPRTELEPDGAFVIENFTGAAPFTSFLPGIAGLWGVPLWLYWVNRGQAVASFGTEDKDHAFLEFQSAARAWRRVPLEGFRTFLRGRRSEGAFFHEPFGAAAGPRAAGLMRIRPSALEIEEIDPDVGLRVAVEYFTVPGEPWAALARSVTIENQAPDAVDLEVVDGLPQVVPYGERATFLQVMPFITEAYLKVTNLEAGVPFLNLKAVPSDTAETEFVRAGHFFCGFLEGEASERWQPIVDPSLVFGERQDFTRPRALLAADAFDATAAQTVHCITPAAMLAGRVTLAAGERRTLRSLYGWTRDRAASERAADAAAEEGWFEAKREAARREVEAVRHRLFLHTAEPRLNEYGPQTYLDNVLRGGLPVTLGAGDGTVVLHVYSRRHGDLERDYNFFRLEPTVLSQGNGAYRDMNQNRRHDVWMNPDVGADDVRQFVNLLQSDGFNPMLVKGVRFRVTADTEALREAVATAVRSTDQDRVVERVAAQAFSPGALVAWIEDQGLRLKRGGPAALLEALFAVSERVEEAEHEVGYWIDHWFYNLDLIESYLAVYPDRLRELLLERDDFTFRDTDRRVRARDERTVLVAPDRVRQTDFVALDAEKAALIAQRTARPYVVRVRDGRGEPYRTNLLGKLLALVAVKVASLSPSGVGMEMDGGRPGWHDSVNGLPGLFGASTSETFQLLRALGLVAEWLDALHLPPGFAQDVPAEVATFAKAVGRALHRYLATDDPDRDHRYWEETSEAKEAYREAVRLGFDGAEQGLSRDEIGSLLAAARARIEASLADATDPETGLPATYVLHEAVEWEPIVDGPAGALSGSKPKPRLGPRGRPCVRVTKFRMRRLPVFLEAPAHALRITKDEDEARDLWRRVRAGPLYDRRLGMYLVNAPVPEELEEIGRIWAWPPGWFERENVFMHLEHKYLLATLEAGLVEEFFEDFRAAAVCFQDPAVFGRSPLENVSFIVASTHPREALHGRGFLPRSSGTTAEVIHMLLWMLFGRRPFAYTEKDGLSLKLAPILPDGFFTTREHSREVVDAQGTPRTETFPADSCTATLVGHTRVTYRNPARRATFGPDAARPARYRVVWDDGREAEFGPEGLDDAAARAVRQKRVAHIEVTLTVP